MITWEIREGDALERLREMPDESVQCAVTSPPYWGLRDYGVPGQLGLETTLEEYVAKMVEVFREVRRVLRSDGTLWLNMGDSYAGGGTIGRNDADRLDAGLAGGHGGGTTAPHMGTMHRRGATGLKSKDLCMIPARVAMALQADGWWLRSDIIWSKPNPMPESVRDRPTKAHEYIFLLTKSATHFYDAEAVAEKALQPIGEAMKTGQGTARMALKVATQGSRVNSANSTSILGSNQGSSHRNKRTVWTITTKPYPEAHFATFPPELPRLCIKAGTSEWGCCVECGAPWERVVERSRFDEKSVATKAGTLDGMKRNDGGRNLGGQQRAKFKRANPDVHMGWRPTCDHEAATAPCTVLDPFAGAGTTGVEALALDRSFIGIELNPEYAKMARDRIDGDCPLFNQGARPAESTPAKGRP